MKRILSILFGSLAMLLLAVIAAFTSMRLAIHGREVDVPSLAGLSDEAAAAAAKKLGLNLSVENRFYSAGVAPNHVLSQAPAAGSLVRRGSQVRVTESLGGQNVSVPDVTGQTERPAVLALRRLQLELGATAHLPAPGIPGLVLAQSPPPNSGGVFGPAGLHPAGRPRVRGSRAGVYYAFSDRAYALRGERQAGLRGPAHLRCGRSVLYRSCRSGPRNRPGCPGGCADPAPGKCERRHRRANPLLPDTVSAAMTPSASPSRVRRRPPRMRPSSP